MATIILIEKPAAVSLTEAYRERQMQNAVLAAKNELVSMATKIDAEAAKGEYRVEFKLSTKIKKLKGAYYDAALEIINADIAAGGYDIKPIYRKDESLDGYIINWGDEPIDTEEPDEGEPDDGSDIRSPEELIAALDEADEVELNIADNLALTAPVELTTGKKATVHLNSDITHGSEVAFVVNGGELVIDGNGEVSGAGCAIAATNGGKVTVNGGTYTSTSAGQTMAAIGAGSTVTINDANVNSQEFAVMAFDGAELDINGGEYNTVDNCVIGTNGTAGRGGNTINIKDATLIGHIQSNGYAACGIYVANNDIVNVENTKIIVENGCGILIRAGNVTVTNTEITTTGTQGGWVGDKKKVMSTSGIIYDEASNYPGKDGMSLVCGPNVTFNCSGETVEILSNEETPNVTIVA